MQTSTPLRRPNVSDGPPRHAAHDASPILHPASSRTCHTVLSLTLVVFIRRATSVVAGTIKVSIFTFSPYIVSAAATKSVFSPRARANIRAVELCPCNLTHFSFIIGRMRFGNERLYFFHIKIICARSTVGGRFSSLLFCPGTHTGSLCQHCLWLPSGLCFSRPNSLCFFENSLATAMGGNFVLRTWHSCSCLLC